MSGKMIKIIERILSYIATFSIGIVVGVVIVEVWLNGL